MFMLARKVKARNSAISPSVPTFISICELIWALSLVQQMHHHNEHLFISLRLDMSYSH